MLYNLFSLFAYSTKIAIKYFLLIFFYRSAIVDKFFSPFNNFLLSFENLSHNEFFLSRFKNFSKMASLEIDLWRDIFSWKLNCAIEVEVNINLQREFLTPLCFALIFSDELNCPWQRKVAKKIVKIFFFLYFFLLLLRPLNFFSVIYFAFSCC